MESEFGKGFIYNLILFSKHHDRIKSDLKCYESIGKPFLAYEMWFYAAADHFFDFEIPPQFKNKLIGKLALKIQNKALNLRLPRKLKKLAIGKDFEDIFKDIEKLAMLIDKEFKVKDIKARFS